MLSLIEIQTNGLLSLLTDEVENKYGDELLKTKTYLKRQREKKSLPIRYTHELENV